MKQINQYHIYLTMFKETAVTSSAGFQVGPLSCLNWNLEMLVFVEEGKQGTQRKTLNTWGELTKNSIHVWHQAGIEPRDIGGR